MLDEDVVEQAKNILLKLEKMTDPSTNKHIPYDSKKKAELMEKKKEKLRLIADLSNEYYHIVRPTNAKDDAL